ncbi:hypothetical protein ACFPK9_08880 [Rubritalea spongiae]|uniref:Peptidase MA-like domain-containing protein n=1 Tax=Rubritalea spongiae TaxID=430797 RepID=A0ABW5E195_9BACT
MKFPKLTVAALSLLSDFLSARTWTDVKGRTLEAEMVSKSESSVTVLVRGQKTEIALEMLSESDQKFVKNWERGDVAGYEALFEQKWPKLVSIDLDIEITEEEGEDGSYIYRSPHYEFISNTELSKVPVKRFSVLFEATREYVRQLPYANKKAHQESVRYQVFLFDTMESYVRAGGPEGSAGVYLGGKDVIMVLCQSLGLVKRGSTWAMDYDRTNKTLPHEITHQLTDREYFVEGARGWFSEGFAEYVAVTPYRSGKFSVSKAPSYIEEYVTSFSRVDNRGRNLGEEILAPRLEKFMTMSYSDFASAENGNFNYGLGALLVTYFNHYDGEGDAANIKNFLRAIKQGKTGTEALEVLRAGRSWEQLEEDVTTGWRKRGVKIDFM